MATPFSPAEQQAIETLRVLNAKASMGAIPSQGSARAEARVLSDEAVALLDGLADSPERARAYLAAIGAPAFRATVAPKARKRA